MTKIVYNACFGGFRLSNEAMREYLTRIETEWTEEPLGVSGSIRFRTTEAGILDQWTISRSDPILVEIVEELGERANGPCSRLEIRDLPPGTMYRIDEYDGSECVVTRDEDDWSVA